jgi:hypothetical protein
MTVMRPSQYSAVSDRRHLLDTTLLASWRTVPSARTRLQKVRRCRSLLLTRSVGRMEAFLTAERPNHRA